MAMASLALMGCYYMPGLGSGGTAKVDLRAVSLSAGPTASSPFVSVVLVVSGPEMGTITNTYTPGTTTATLTVPAGLARTFTLLENTPSVTFMGDTTVDLAPGDTKSLVLTTSLAESQIIVPDYLGNRLVQVSDMKGTGWTTFAPGFGPYDVDFDNQGRVYFSSGSYSNNYVWRIDDISGANLTAVASGSLSRYTYSIAMDRTRGLLYYTDGSSLYQIQATPTVGTEASVALSTLTAYPSLYAEGIAVDSDGYVYMAGTYATGVIVLKLDPTAFPSSLTVVASYTGSLSFPWDVLVQGDYIYVSDSSARQIVRLTKSLLFVDSFSGPPSDPFLGPERFVAILNKPITVMDEGPSEKRLASFSDMKGTGWTTYGSSLGTGQGQFLFFNSSG